MIIIYLLGCLVSCILSILQYYLGGRNNSYYKLVSTLLIILSWFGAGFIFIAVINSLISKIKHR